MNKHFKIQTILTLLFKILVFILIITLVSGFGYYIFLLQKKLETTNASLSTEKVDKANLEIALASSTHDVQELSEALYSEQQEKNNLYSQMEQIKGTVGELVKLSKTDPELLKKYSKVYFLNENYIPSKLSFIDQKYLVDQNRKLELSNDVWPFMQKLLIAAEKDGADLRIASAYRSFGEQSALKTAYKTTYGSGANKFSADQGYSEHQLGTTVDFSTTKIGGVLLGFEKTDAYKWLQNNAHKYGFVISYPQGNKYYIFEPWHWRFVGIALATSLHDNGKYFYDLEQRKIDSYLITLFDTE